METKTLDDVFQQLAIMMTEIGIKAQQATHDQVIVGWKKGAVQQHCLRLSTAAHAMEEHGPAAPAQSLLQSFHPNPRLVPIPSRRLQAGDRTPKGVGAAAGGSSAADVEVQGAEDSGDGVGRDKLAEVADEVGGVRGKVLTGRELARVDVDRDDHNDRIGGGRNRHGDK